MTDLIKDTVNKVENGKLVCLSHQTYLKLYTVDHNILLDKLKYYGFEQKTFNLIKSYLKERIQRVNLNNESSGGLYVKFVVPQSSCLGPFFQFIY